MILTHIIANRISRQTCDELNRESGRHYTNVMKWHWRIYRKQGLWLSQSKAEKLEDFLGESTILHAHSRDAAQQAFYKACKTAKTLRQKGDPAAKYPHKRKRYRTTIWKNTGIRKNGRYLLLARARGVEPLAVQLPDHLAELPGDSFSEARLVYNRKTKRYEWHLVIDDGQEMPAPPGTNIVSVDLGEIHPAVATDLSHAVIFSVRELRALYQYRNKQIAGLQEAQSNHKKRSRRWWKLERRRRKLLGFVERKARDILHKIARSLVAWAVERQAGVIVIGDVRDINQGKRLNRQSQQKVSQWPHGKLRRYITYKAAMSGIRVELVSEAYSTRSCPNCGHQKKRTGRDFHCLKCGLVAHRDVVGAINIRSIYDFGEVAHYQPPTDVKVSHPFKVHPERCRRVRSWGGTPEPFVIKTVKLAQLAPAG